MGTSVGANRAHNSCQRKTHMLHMCVSINRFCVSAVCFCCSCMFIKMQTGCLSIFLCDVWGGDWFCQLWKWMYVWAFSLSAMRKVSSKIGWFVCVFCRVRCVVRAVHMLHNVESIMYTAKLATVIYTGYVCMYTNGNNCWHCILQYNFMLIESVCVWFSFACEETFAWNDLSVWDCLTCQGLLRK